MRPGPPWWRTAPASLLIGERFGTSCRDDFDFYVQWIVDFIVVDRFFVRSWASINAIGA